METKSERELENKALVNMGWVVDPGNDSEPMVSALLKWKAGGVNLLIGPSHMMGDIIMDVNRIVKSVMTTRKMESVEIVITAPSGKVHSMWVHKKKNVKKAEEHKITTDTNRDSDMNCYDCGTDEIVGA